MYNNPIEHGRRYEHSPVMDCVQLSAIAARCRDYETIAAAQGYGQSMLNFLPVYPRCDQCVNWFGGTCRIYLEHLTVNT